MQELSATDVLILSLIRSFTERNGNYSGKTDHLAEWAHCKRKTALDSLSKLEEHGHIRIERRPGKTSIITCVKFTQPNGFDVCKNDTGGVQNLHRSTAQTCVKNTQVVCKNDTGGVQNLHRRCVKNGHDKNIYKNINKISYKKGEKESDETVLKFYREVMKRQPTQELILAIRDSEMQLAEIEQIIMDAHSENYDDNWIIERVRGKTL